MPGLVLTMASGPTFGAFGKIPALGDFFRISLPADFIAAWDVWLQGGMQAARAALGPRWRDCYMSAPIWRFTLAAGVAGRAPVEGVLMASVDRVGRQFPLTLARPLTADADPVASHLAGGARFAALETVALAALDDGVAQARLQQDLAGIDLSLPLPAACGVTGTGPGFLALCTDAPDDAPAGALAGALAASLARRSFPRPVVFSALVPGGQVVILTDGLPPAERFRDLVDPAPCGGSPS